MAKDDLMVCINGGINSGIRLKIELFQLYVQQRSSLKSRTFL